MESYSLLHWIARLYARIATGNGRRAGPTVVASACATRNRAPVIICATRADVRLVRLLVNAAAMWVATQVVPGVSYGGGVWPMWGLAQPPRDR